MPIPNVGRFSILSDPQGAAFALIEYSEEFPKPAVDTHGVHGHGWWRELHASDQPAAYGFYSGLFGWEGRDPQGVTFALVGDRKKK